MRKKEVASESKNLAENLLKHIVDYQSEENLVQMRWTNPGVKGKRSANSKIDITDSYYEIESSTISLSKEVQPKPVRFEQKNDFMEISNSLATNKNDSYTNPFEQPSLSLNAQMILEEAKLDESRRKLSEKEHIEMLGDKKTSSAGSSRKYKLAGLPQA
jgi:hypothetical protein